MDYKLGQPASPRGDDWPSTSHRFQCRKSEGLMPDRRRQAEETASPCAKHRVALEHTQADGARWPHRGPIRTTAADQDQRGRFDQARIRAGQDVDTFEPPQVAN